MMNRLPEATPEAKSVKNGQNEGKEERERAECQKKSVDQRKCWRGSEVQDLHLTLCATTCVLHRVCYNADVGRWCVVSIVLSVVRLP